MGKQEGIDIFPKVSCVALVCRFTSLATLIVHVPLLTRGILQGSQLPDKSTVRSRTYHISAARSTQLQQSIRPIEVLRTCRSETFDSTASTVGKSGKSPKDILQSPGAVPSSRKGWALQYRALEQRIFGPTTGNQMVKD